MVIDTVKRARHRDKRGYIRFMEEKIFDMKTYLEYQDEVKPTFPANIPDPNKEVKVKPPIKPYVMINKASPMKPKP